VTVIPPFSKARADSFFARGNPERTASSGSKLSKMTRTQLKPANNSKQSGERAKVVENCQETSFLARKPPKNPLGD
jgi:hypothetical protein